MRIAIFIKATTFHKNFGGFETQNKALSEGLASKGNEVVVFSPKKELQFGGKHENGVQYVFVDCKFRKFNFLFSANKDSWWNRSYEEFKVLHAQKPFDIVLSQSSGALGLIHHKTKLNIKIISIAHGSKISEYQTLLKNAKSLKSYFQLLIDLPHVFNAFFRTQRQFIHGSDKIIAVSKAVKKSLIDETFVAEDKIIVIHNGVDVAQFSQVSNNLAVKDLNNNIRFVFVGRILRAKGVFDLIDAFKLIQANNLSLDIVGDGVDLAELKHYVTVKDVQNVNFHGVVPYDRVLEILLSCDVFVFPTQRVEGFPMVLVEAMLSGLAIIATDIGGNSDAITHMQTGFLIKPGDVTDLANKMSQLAKAATLRKEIGERARIKATKEFSVEAMLEKYQVVIKETLQ